MLIYEKAKVNSELSEKAYNFIIEKFKKSPFKEQLDYEKIDIALLTTIGKKDYKPNSAVFVTEYGLFVYRVLVIGKTNGQILKIRYEQFEDIFVKNAFISKLIIKTKKDEIKVETAAYIQENFDLLSLFKNKIASQIAYYKELETRRISEEEIKVPTEDDIILPEINLDINTVLDNGNRIKITDYKEGLKSGGTLIVAPVDSRIYYYFPGPDLRYNGDSFNIYISGIDKYIEALKINFSKYLELKEKLKTETITCEGELGMKININSYPEGVCLFSYHKSIKTQKELDKLIYDFRYAKARAKQVHDIMTKIKKEQQ